MSTYALVQRGVAHADSTVNAGVSPLDIVLGTAIKLGSAFVVGRLKDRRDDASVQRGTINLTSASVSPLDTVITSVDTATAEVKMTFKQKRTNSNTGVTLKLLDATHIRAQFDTIAAGDTVDIEWEVVERKARRGVNIRILDATHLRLEWDGVLVPGESIDMAYDVFDYSAAGDDVKELLFRLQRILGYLGENVIQDLLTYDTAGNLVSYRARVFDSQTDADNATFDIAEASALQTGELSRILVTIDIDIANNDRQSLLMTLDKLETPTPGVG